MWMQAVGVGRPVAPRWRLRPLMPERGDDHRKVFPPVLNPDPGQGPGISPSRRITARASPLLRTPSIVSFQKRQQVVPACEGPLSSLLVCVWLLEILQRGLPCPHQSHLRRIGLSSVLQEATRLHDGREAQEQRLISNEQFTNQHEAE